MCSSHRSRALPTANTVHSGANITSSMLNARKWVHGILGIWVEGKATGLLSCCKYILYVAR